MSTLSQFSGGGFRPPKTIVNQFSSAGHQSTNLVSAIGAASPKVVLSGSMTANTLKSIVSVTGAGCLLFCGAYRAGAVARTLRAKLTIDGVVVFDYTSASSSSTNDGLFVVGGGAYGAPSAVLEPALFNTSFDFEIASDVTGTDEFYSFYKYQTY